MSRSTIYQILILFLIFLIMISTYYFFFNNQNKQPNLNESSQSKNMEISNNESGNTIDDLYYISTDKSGNSYEITSESGELDPDKGDVIKLKNVKAIINIKNSGIVYISSKFAHYNRDNLNTYFYDDVDLNFNQHYISSNDIEMNYVNKNIKISGNVNYKNDNNHLNADIIEMNLLTKVSKIYMKKRTDRVKALILN